jgi:creatinine amidohydrolase/Fe(II)-dependent formamide hydrolase-like protein
MAKSQEAAGKKAKKILADTMTTADMRALRERNGIVLLPVGCFEMHDLHVGMACDSFLVEAACRILAEEWDAVILPTIHYTYPGATARWPGSVAVRPVEALGYVMAVVKAILRNGFKRLIIVSAHGPNTPMIQVLLRNVFEETGELPLLLSPPEGGAFYRQIEEEFGHPHGEAAWYLASLYICGRHGDFDPACPEEEAQPRRVPSLPSMKGLAGKGASMPYVFVSPWDHVGRHPGLTLDDAPRLAEIYREHLLKQVERLPEAYEKVQQDVWKAVKDAPWDKF